MKSRKILVTSALPYANGAIHLGHLLECVQTDIWVRFQRQMGNECHYICADDAHGTAIMLRAKAEGVTPVELIDRVRDEHIKDFSEFNISFDRYGSTHALSNEKIVEYMFHRLSRGGYIDIEEVEQPYDEEAGMFLSDRYIKGQCPRCGAFHQYGDHCEECGAVYDAFSLIDPYSVISKSRPVKRKTEQLYFLFGKFNRWLHEWIVDKDPFQREITNKMMDTLDDHTRSWCISRDEPYFGFPIPEHEGKFFYVWMDAPAGYISTFEDYCMEELIGFRSYFREGEDTEMHHFIGKDIAYFHCLLWPAILKACDLRRPTKVHCHGFLTLNGRKMSKSKGDFLTAKGYLKLFKPDYFRYWAASKLNSSVADIDITAEDFTARVNSELNAKLVNIFSRCSRLIESKFGCRLLTDGRVMEHDLVKEAVEMRDKTASNYESMEYSSVVRDVMGMADKINRHISENRPWDAESKSAHVTVSASLVAFAQLMLYLRPVLPELTDKAKDFLGVKLEGWNKVSFTASHHISPYAPLLDRIDQGAARVFFKTLI